MTLQSTFASADQQVITIIVSVAFVVFFAHLLGSILQRLGLPRVLGEIIAGIIIGTLLVGSPYQLDVAVKESLKLIGHLGIMLLMFKLGATLFDEKKSSIVFNKAIVTSLCIIIISFLFGFAFGELSSSSLAPTINSLHYSLFMGLAGSITAVPVLWRIIEDLDIGDTRAGKMAMSIASISDLVAWVLLSLISSFLLSDFSFVKTLVKISTIVAYILFILFILRKYVIHFVDKKIQMHGVLSNLVISITILITFVSGWVANFIGISDIFGCFLTGVIFGGKKIFISEWDMKISGFVNTFLVPVFFVTSGLNVDIFTLDISLIWWCAGAILILSFGKLFATYFSFILLHRNTNDALIVGILLNTRGLVELIIINYGLSSGFLSQKAYTVMLCMTIVTTMLTGPLIRLSDFVTKKKLVLS